MSLSRWPALTVRMIGRTVAEAEGAEEGGVKGVAGPEAEAEFNGMTEDKARVGGLKEAEGESGDVGGGGW